ncbi:MAG TPA: paraquat-inducible protein A [Gemmatimonadales bacterium]|nr:paraquat-inducible protein A [Gemmatimonadales bacterium]
MKKKIMHPRYTAAFSLAALLLYLPANVFPILRLNLYGATSENTVWQGCVKFYEEGDYFIALIVFLASIAIPLLKIVGLLFLSLSLRFRWVRWKTARVRLYAVIDSVGRWAMLDVFVLAVLVSLVKLQKLATVVAGKGLLAFSLVVVLTLLASQVFDPRWISEDRSVAA